MIHQLEVDIFYYRIFYIQELRNSMKGLIYLKNKDNECFKWCHIRFINPTNSHPEIINKQD